MKRKPLASLEANRPLRRFHVLMIAPTSFFADYGCHVRILEETRVLQQLGHRVTIVTYRNGNNVPGVDVRRTLPIPWRQSYEVGSSRHKLGFDFLLGLKTMQLLGSNHFDVIHAHLHEGALLGLTLGKLARLPVVFDFQGSLTEEMIDHKFLQRDSLIYRPLVRLEEWIDQRAHAVLTSSANARNLLIQRFGRQAEGLHLLPDCVNADVFKPTNEFDVQQLAGLRAQLGIPPEAKVIVYLGLLAEYQGTGLLLHAMQRVLHKQPNAYLLLMGFPGVNLYQQQAQNLGIQQRVIFTGKVPYGQAPIHLALGDVAVAPKLSVSEGAGKLLNYMATGLPTVAFDTPVAREYLGAYGSFAARGDVRSLADRLSQALSGDRSTQLNGQRLRQRAIQHFSWQRAGQIITEVYAQVAGEATAPKVAIDIA
jgi:glycosyltransferase involved in cell wall biosynthesis